MKLKLLIFAIITIIFNIAFMGCNNSNNNIKSQNISSKIVTDKNTIQNTTATVQTEQNTANAENSPNKNTTSSVHEEQNTIDTKTSKNTTTSVQTKQNVTSKSNVDYSIYTGTWICKDKHTSMDIKVDNKGNVKGSITTVVGSHVPASSITGTIENGVLTSKISSNDEISGTLTLSFTDPNVLKSNVKLDNHNSYFTIAEGDLLFERYLQK